MTRPPSKDVMARHAEWMRKFGDTDAAVASISGCHDYMRRCHAQMVWQAMQAVLAVVGVCESINDGDWTCMRDDVANAAGWLP